MRTRPKSLLLFYLFILISGIPLILDPNCYYFIHEEYFFYPIATVAVVISVIFFFKSNTKKYSILNFNLIDLTIFVFFFYILFRSLFPKHPIHFFKVINSVYLIFIYIGVRNIIKFQKSFISNKYIFESILIFLLFIGFFEIGVAFLQNFGIINNLQPNLKFGGTFGNTAPFALFLTSLIPFFLAYFHFYKDEGSLFIRVLCLAIGMLCIFFIAISKIRSAWISVIVVIAFTAQYRFHILELFKRINPVIKITSLIVVILICILTANYAFNMKKDSALGRIFIWKNSINITKDHFFTGIGLSNFTYGYNIQQSSSFQKGDYKERDFLIADDIKMAFNDLVQISAELGIVGLLLFLAIIFSSFYYSLNHINKAPPIVYASILSMLTILISGLTSYPLTILRIQLLFIITLSIISAYSDKILIRYKFNTRFLKFFASVSACMLLLSVWISSNEYFFSREWYKISNSKNINHETDQLNDLRKLYPKLKHRPEFLYNYSAILYSQGQFDEALFIAGRLNKYLNNYDYYLNLGDYYATTGNFIGAEEAYKKCLNIIPSRFIPRNNLLQIYKLSGERDKSIEISKEILMIPVKINSDEVEKIKIEAKKTLNINIESDNKTDIKAESYN